MMVGLFVCLVVVVFSTFFFPFSLSVQIINIHSRVHIMWFNNEGWSKYLLLAIAEEIIWRRERGREPYFLPVVTAPKRRNKVKPFPLPLCLTRTKWLGYNVFHHRLVFRFVFHHNDDHEQWIDWSWGCLLLTFITGTGFCDESLQLLPIREESNHEHPPSSAHPNLHPTPIFSLIIGGSCHKYNFCHKKSVLLRPKFLFCRDKHMFVKMKKLSWHKYICCDKHFFFLFATNVLLWHIFVAQQMFCHDKPVCHNKHIFSQGQTYLSWQKHVCHDKSFAMTKMCLSRQIFCHDKNHTCGSSYEWYPLASKSDFSRIKESLQPLAKAKRPPVALMAAGLHDQI